MSAKCFDICHRQLKIRQQNPIDGGNLQMLKTNFSRYALGVGVRHRTNTQIILLKEAWSKFKELFTVKLFSGQPLLKATQLIVL